MTAFAVLGSWVWLSWTVALTAAMFGRVGYLAHPSGLLDAVWRAFARLHQELWLFAAPGILVNAVESWHTSGEQWLLVAHGYALYVWWRFRDWPDDNHWRRRARKAREAIARRGARLVVVPAGASS